MTMTTQAAVLFELGKPLRIIELEIPPLERGQVLVDLVYSGVCKSQLLETRGKRGPDRFLPHTLGHEGSGIVVAVGDGVDKVKTGDRVVVSWIKGTGADVRSTVYASSEGPINSGAVSTFMRRTVTCENRLTPVPDAMPLREAALLGCAIPTGVGAVLNTAQVQPGSSVAVFGLGGVGMSAVLASSLVPDTTFIAIDIVDRKLELARQLGAAHLVNALRENPVEAVVEITGGQGADYAIEAAGTRQTMEAAFESVRRGGGLCVLAGNLPYGGRINIDPFDLICGKRIVGTWGGDSEPDRDIPTYVDLYLNGKLRLEPLITHEHALQDINLTLDAIDAGEIGRGVINLNL